MKIEKFNFFMIMMMFIIIMLVFLVSMEISAFMSLMWIS